MPMPPKKKMPVMDRGLPRIKVRESTDVELAMDALVERAIDVPDSLRHKPFGLDDLSDQSDQFDELLWHVEDVRRLAIELSYKAQLA